MSGVEEKVRGSEQRGQRNGNSLGKNEGDGARAREGDKRNVESKKQKGRRNKSAAWGGREDGDMGEGESDTVDR